MNQEVQLLHLANNTPDCCSQSPLFDNIVGALQVVNQNSRTTKYFKLIKEAEKYKARI